MGIYSDGIVYGIKVIQKNPKEDCNSTVVENEYITIYEKTSNKAISKDMIQEAHHKYNELQNKNNCRFFIYSNCSTSYDLEDVPFMMWENIDKNEFLEL
jgi:hypothetical protein